MTTGTRKLARAALNLILTITSTPFIEAREVFRLSAECVKVGGKTNDQGNIKGCPISQRRCP